MEKRIRRPAAIFLVMLMTLASLAGQPRAAVPTKSLVAFRDGITFVDPVRAEIIGDIEGFHVGESHGLQGVVGGLHVGAVGPGAASAIEDDESLSRQGLDVGAEALQAGRIRCGSNVFGAGDVRLRVEDVRSDMNENRLLAFGGLKDLDQVIDGDEVRAGNLAGLKGKSGGDYES